MIYFNCPKADDVNLIRVVSDFIDGLIYGEMLLLKIVLKPHN